MNKNEKVFIEDEIHRLHHTQKVKGNLQVALLEDMRTYATDMNLWESIPYDDIVDAYAKEMGWHPLEQELSGLEIIH